MVTDHERGWSQELNGQRAFGREKTFQKSDVQTPRYERQQTKTDNGNLLVLVLLLYDKSVPIHLTFTDVLLLR